MADAAAFCSSSAAVSPKKYDVFISFRGEDTRSNFTSHLHEALCRNQIETYIDYRLEKGDEVWSSLVKAIQDSILFLIVFSENYASSRWCLNELTKILECSKDHKEHLVIPVFYKTDPSHVRKQTGSYEIAFTKHEHNNHKQQLQKWKDALTQAANLSGWHCDAERNEAEVIGEIVKCVLMNLDHKYTSDSNGLVGIHERVADLESLLFKGSQDVRFIGIWGMGGIGKTTLAAAVFNKLCFAYEGFCFLMNVREESKKYGITYLKNKLLSTLLDDIGSHNGMPDGGTPYVMRRLSRKKVLVVLDDVNDSEQLEKLVGAHTWFGPGSRIVITTRDKQVMIRKIDDIYEVKVLNFDEALQLFYLNAFKNNCPDMEFRQLSRRVVDYAKCIPLALKVLASLLYGKGKNEWKSQLEKLKKMPCTKIQDVLRLSYDGLDREEKSIFLDVACFFKGRGVEDIKILLDACGYSTTIGLRSLQEKSLLTISKEEVSMHDLMQEMGWEIVREESIEDPEKRSRLWDPNDIYQVLKNDIGTEAIKGITLDVSKIEELCLSPLVFARMPKLKFLQIYGSISEEQSLHLPKGLKSLPNELRCLHWDVYPLKSLPSTFSAEKLVTLEMQNSQVRKLWHGTQNLVNLKAIKLRWSEQLIELPDFSKALILEDVDLQGCTNLRHVHPSLFSLHKLAKLHLEFCKELKSLQSEDCLTSLEELSVHGCSSLQEFSIRSEKMTRLLLGSTAIGDLPSLVSHLNKLEWLEAPYSESLRNLPENFLEALTLNNCGQRDISSLFASDALRSLKSLRVDTTLSKLPDNINLLSSMQHLSLGTSDVESLPASMKHLSQLRSLDIFLCVRLQSIPELPPSVEFLDARECKSLETVSSLTAEPLKKQHRSCFLFQNCLKLDEHARNTIMEDAYVRIKRAANDYLCTTSTEDEDAGSDDKIHISVHFPINKFPDWFTHWTSEDSITVQFPPHSRFVAFIFCLVLPQFNPDAPDYLEALGCQCYMKKGDARKFLFESFFQNDDDNWYDISETQLDSDHTYLWYDEEYCLEINNGARGGKANDQCTNNIEVQFEFFVETRLGKSEVAVKESGVCPIYISDHLNFDEQGSTKVQICEEVDEFDDSRTEIGDGSSGEKKEEPKPLLPLQKSAFPPRPTGAWKYNERKGLKELMLLVDTFSS